MKRISLLRKKLQLMPGIFLLMVVFLFAGKPLLAAPMTDTISPVENRDGMTVLMGNAHALFDTEPQVRQDTDMPQDGHAMVCCIETGESFLVPGNIFLRMALESGLVPAGASVADDILESCFAYNHTPPPSGEITLLSQCQRE